MEENEMQAVLYIGHGSRVTEGREQAVQMIERAIQSIHVPIQEICFLELASPTILEGVKHCVERGATKIAVVPVLLLTATHAKKDIPLEIEKAKKRYPHIQFDYGKPFGVHPKIIDSLMDRVNEKKVDIKADAMVLLVGRGSRDPDVKRDLTKIAQLLHEKHPFKKVNICFLTAAKPSFEEGLQCAKQSKHKQVFVLPYLLFTGILMKGIVKTIQQLNSEKQQFILCDSLGYHPHLLDVLLERVQQLTDG